jgi:prepilin-type N-terminal cleavage/methylation domain-containing protein
MIQRIVTNHTAQRPGFTLVELMTVLALIAILAGFAFPRLNFTKYRMDGNVRSARMALQNAQRLAVTRQYDVVVTFDPGEQSIRIHEDANNNGVIDAGERVLWRPLEDGAVFAVPPVGVNGAVAQAIVGSNLRLIDGNPAVIFRRSGAASTDLELYVGSPRGDHGDFRAVAVVQATGRTEAFRFDGVAWKKGRL